MDEIKNRLIKIITKRPELLQNLNISIPGVWRFADHLIANGVTVQEWIPASEPPKEKGWYWCNVKSFTRPGMFYQKELKWDNGFIEGHIYTDDVTHWMPLPQPPKEE